MTVVFHESCVSVSEGAVACENARVCKLKQRVLPQKETRERIERPTGKGRNEEDQYMFQCLVLQPIPHVCLNLSISLCTTSLPMRFFSITLLHSFTRTNVSRFKNRAHFAENTKIIT